LRVEQRGGQHRDAAGWQTHPDEVEGHGVVDQMHAGGLSMAAGGIGDLRGHGHSGLPRVQEGLDTGPLRAIHAGQERNAALPQQSEQPDGGKAALHDEEIVAGEMGQQARQERALGGGERRPTTALNINREMVANSPKARARTWGCP